MGGRRGRERHIVGLYVEEGRSCRQRENGEAEGGKGGGEGEEERKTV